MEASSQSLSIDSFSYSWLVNLGDSFRASIDASDDYYETAFIEMDPTLPPSKRFFNVDPHDFDFPTSQSTLVHADELISNGFLMPLKNMEVISDSIPNTPSQSEEHNSARKRNSIIRCASLKRCRRFSRQILVKYLEILRPFCQKIRRFSKVGKSKRSIEEYSSPRTSVAYSVDNWRMSCDSETSIHEAVLHCKRTINGK